MNQTANRKELVNDLMMKAKQIEYLIQSLPTPEPEEVQVRARACAFLSSFGPYDNPGLMFFFICARDTHYRLRASRCSRKRCNAPIKNTQQRSPEPVRPIYYIQAPPSSQVFLPIPIMNRGITCTDQ